MINPYTSKEHKTTSEWHTFWVFEDKEFISEVSNLVKWQDEAIAKYGVGKANYYKSDEHTEFKKRSKDLANKFALKRDDVSRFIMENRSYEYSMYKPFNSFSTPIFSISGDDKEFEVTFPGNITYEDYISSWKQIVEFRANHKGFESIKPGRRRAPDNTQLIYAIFKARIRGLKFREIFKLYENGILPYYEGKSNIQYKDEDSLESYYQKYKPIT